MQTEIIDIEESSVDSINEQPRQRVRTRSPIPTSSEDVAASENSGASTTSRGRPGVPRGGEVPVRSASKHRNFVLTWNNPGSAEEFQQMLSGLSPTFYIFQLETGEQGTPHFQGCVCFKNPRAFRAVTRGLPGVHVDVMRGTVAQAVAYCTKEETRTGEIISFGTQPRNGGNAGGRSDLDTVADSITGGAYLRTIAAEHPVEFIKFNKGIERLIGLRDKPRDTPTKVYWYYGRTGTGKSRAACAEAPDAYWKDPSSSWWCGYEGHDDVIIDDYRLDFCKFSQLLRYFDRYPLTVQIKGGSRQFRPKRIFVTAPQSPTEMWSSRTEEDIQQLLRRITEIKRFDSLV